MVGIVALAAAAAPGAATADALDDIRKRGKLIVGVKADQPPYGFLGSDGQIAGLEPELARDVAAVPGVQPGPGPRVASKRMQLHQRGQDAPVSTPLADNDDRRERGSEVH